MGNKISFAAVLKEVVAPQKKRKPRQERLNGKMI